MRYVHLGKKMATLGFVLFHMSRVLLSFSSSVLLSLVGKHRIHMKPETSQISSSDTAKSYLVLNE